MIFLNAILVIASAWSAEAQTQTQSLAQLPVLPQVTAQIRPPSVPAPTRVPAQASLRQTPICDYVVVEEFDRARNYDFVYYRVRNLEQFYKKLQSVFNAGRTSGKMSVDDCWKQVELELTRIGIPGDVEFKTHGAPDSFKDWYDEWYRGQFNAPIGIRSRSLEFLKSNDNPQGI